MAGLLRTDNQLAQRQPLACVADEDRHASAPAVRAIDRRQQRFRQRPVERQLAQVDATAEHVGELQSALLVVDALMLVTQPSRDVGIGFADHRMERVHHERQPVAAAECDGPPRLNAAPSAARCGEAGSALPKWENQIRTGISRRPNEPSDRLTA
ncbi:hypothetical protein [Burkholderia sp. Bp9004]|uniref:hypothetical protein n=1 Tax=Burkholderia sp. Bp9004 TaxID=2184559 RepID=UPI0021AB7054|nr:hypothetical protein [Burkholderia sp. Bp9004]